MPIQKGEPWGQRGGVPPKVINCRHDAEVAATVWAARNGADDGGDELVAVRAFTGDLLKTVGGTQGAPESSGTDVLLLPVDLCVASIDDGEAQPFVAHLVAHHFGWRGEAAAVMNAAWHGDWYLGPRSHPNDGLVDTTVGRLPFRQRLEASRRAKLGSHLPHPALTTTRRSSWSHEFERPTPVFLDGQEPVNARRVSVEVEPDAFILVL